MTVLTWFSKGLVTRTLIAPARQRNFCESPAGGVGCFDRLLQLSVWLARPDQLDYSCSFCEEGDARKGTGRRAGGPFSQVLGGNEIAVSALLAQVLKQVDPQTRLIGAQGM